jgi:hypothetical protein
MVTGRNMSALVALFYVVVLLSAAQGELKAARVVEPNSPSLMAAGGRPAIADDGAEKEVKAFHDIEDRMHRCLINYSVRLVSGDETSGSFDADQNFVANKPGRKIGSDIAPQFACLKDRRRNQTVTIPKARRYWRIGAVAYVEPDVRSFNNSGHFAIIGDGIFDKEVMRTGAGSLHGLPDQIRQ